MSDAMEDERQRQAGGTYMADLKRSSDLIAHVEEVERYRGLIRLRITVNGDARAVLHRLQLSGITTVKIGGQMIGQNCLTWDDYVEQDKHLHLTINSHLEDKISIEVSWSAGRDLSSPPHHEAHHAVAA